MNQRRRTIRHLNALSRLLILGVLLTLFLLVTSSNALPTSTKSRSKTKTKTKSKTKTRTKTTSTVKPAVTWFKPQPHQFTWNYQLYSDTANPILTNLPNVTLYDLDVFDLPLSQATSLKQKSGKLICYFSAGSYENWRSDANTFPASVLGAKLDGWEGEQWLDVRSLAALRPIMVARMKLAKSKGCDAVDPDNVDAFAQGSTLSEVKQNTGFPITKQDQVNYLKMLATEAHALGMGIGLKNALDLIPNVVGVFDFAINESCLQYSECSLYSPFLSARKPVYAVDYQWTAATKADVCTRGNKAGLELLLKDGLLKSARVDCWAGYPH